MNAPVAPTDLGNAGVSVIVPTWNLARREQLRRCLGAISRQSRPPEEVVVVVDGNPELLAWARAALPAAIVVANAGERGVVGARNTGLEAASGEILVLTDDDTEADPGWIENLIVPFSDPAVVGVTGSLVPAWSGSEPRWFPPEFYWVVGCTYAGLPDHPAPVRNPIAANMAVRRAAIEAVGGFHRGVEPHRISHGGTVIAGGHALEDTVLGIEIGRRLPGTKWLFQPRASVRHNVDPEQATLRYLVRRSLEEGLGKAALAGAVGYERGLESERRHLFVVVPRAIGRGFLDLLRGDPYGAARAAAILAGAGAAVSGFLAGSLRARLSGRAPGPIGG